jgi:hypothetical protein
MKKNRSVETVTDPAKPTQAMALSRDNVKKLPVEPDLSPKRIMDGASITTTVLSQILAQREQVHQIRDWGIND